MTLPIVLYFPAIWQKQVLFIGFSATLYDHLLMLDDEVKYVWRSRKSLISYLYILNRALLIAYQFWNFHFFIILMPDATVLSTPGVFHIPSQTYLIAATCIQTLSSALFLLSSDVFVTLRSYAMSRSRIFTSYLATLALARFVAFLTGTFLPASEGYDVYAVDSKLNLVSVSIGTAFEVSAFAAVVWYTYQNQSTFKISALARATVKQATVYFIVIVAVQIYLQVLLSLGTRQDFFGSATTSVYCFFNPVLTLRFALALKQAGDPQGGEKWEIKHFSTLKFVDRPPPDEQNSAAPESIGMVSVNTSHGLV